MTTPPVADGPPPPIPATDEAWAALVAAFEDHSLPWSGWRHPQHLAVTLWYVRRDGVATTYRDLPGRIRAFNAAHGVETTLERGYHETLTRFWLALVAEYWAKADAGAEAGDLLAGLDAKLGDKYLPRAYYTPERINGWEARRGWVPPDLQPFPAAAYLPAEALGL